MDYYLIDDSFDWTNIPNTYANATWEIRKSLNLGGVNVTLPEGVTLHFNGGKLTNFNDIIGNNTKIKAGLEHIFVHTFDGNGNLLSSLSGTFYSDCHIEWVGAVADAFLTTEEVIISNSVLNSSNSNSVTFNIERWGGTDNMPLKSAIINLIEVTTKDIIFSGTYYFDETTSFDRYNDNKDLSDDEKLKGNFKDVNTDFNIFNLKNRTFKGGALVSVYLILYDSIDISFENISFYGQTKPFELPENLKLTELGNKPLLPDGNKNKSPFTFIFEKEFTARFLSVGGIHFRAVTKGCRNISANNCVVESKTSGFATAPRQPNSGIVNKNMTITNCQFESILYHCVQGANHINLTVSNCVADKVFSGTLNDSSDGVINTTISNNAVTNCNKPFKFDSLDTDHNGQANYNTAQDGVVSGNSFKGWEVVPYDKIPQLDVFSVNGAGQFIISNNIFEITRTDTIANLGFGNTLLTNNKFIVKNELNEDPENGEPIVYAFNEIPAFNAPVSDDFKVVFKNNIFEGKTIEFLYQGKATFKNNIFFNSIHRLCFVRSIVNLIENTFYNISHISTPKDFPMISKNVFYYTKVPIVIRGNTFKNINNNYTAGNGFFVNANQRDIYFEKNIIENSDKPGLIYNSTSSNAIIRDNRLVIRNRLLRSYNESTGNSSYIVNGNNITYIPSSGQLSDIIIATNISGSEERLFTNNIITNNSNLDLSVTATFQAFNVWNKTLNYIIQGNTSYTNS